MSEENAQFLEILLWNETETVVREGRRRTVNNGKSVHLLVLQRLRFTVHEMVDKIELGTTVKLIKLKYFYLNTIIETPFP
jgi:hypothetical protein